MAHPDLDELLNAVLTAARHLLQKNGEFFPIGTSMTTEGKVVYDAAYDGTERPPPQRLIALFTEAYRQQAGQGRIRAAAICYDVRTVPPGTSEKTDAICVDLEHRRGETVTVYLPYTRGRFGRVTYGALFATKRAATIFG